MTLRGLVGSISRFAAICLCAAVLLPTAGEAGDVFTIDRLEVDAEGGSAAEAREIALARGRTAALRALLRRLTPQDYWSVLPQVASADAVSMVSGIQVSNEKTSTTRYLADVTFSFEANRIREILRFSQIPFSETQARDAVLLPVLETADGLLLWEEENLWATHWKERNLANELVPLLSPLGELEDIVSVNVSDAVAEDWQSLGAFANRYGVGDVMLAKATLQGEGATQSLLIRAARVSSRDLELGVPGDIEVLVRNRQGFPIEELVDFGIDQILLRLQETWKRQTIIVADAVENMLSASVRFDGMREWRAIKDRLSNMPPVRDVKIEALSLTGAELLVRYVGTPSQLRVALAQQDLNLLESGMVNLIALRESLSPSQDDGLGMPFDDSTMEEFGDVEVIDIFGAAEETPPEEFSPLDDFPPNE